MEAIASHSVKYPDYPILCAALLRQTPLWEDPFVPGPSAASGCDCGSAGDDGTGKRGETPDAPGPTQHLRPPGRRVTAEPWVWLTQRYLASARFCGRAERGPVGLSSGCEIAPLMWQSLWRPTGFGVQQNGTLRILVSKIDLSEDCTGQGTVVSIGHRNRVVRMEFLTRPCPHPPAAQLLLKGSLLLHSTGQEEHFAWAKKQSRLTLSTLASGISF
ncbi:hypothetical protein COCON_G00117250 [Conger conger]|uniref:Uncharacterized protein n=1 Tax=Conger conger TaxID=82655 RepID=A0A9Q1DG55_CONCO|nr:hypothetical protein COCON_G00117250 [Conger conger]